MDNDDELGSLLQGKQLLTGEETTITELKIGEPLALCFSRPIRYRLEFATGSHVCGILMPNTELVVCSEGDVTQFSIVIEEDLLTAPSLIEAQEDSSS